MLDEKQKAKYLKVIMCQTEGARQDLAVLTRQISDQATLKLLKSLYQNGHTVISTRSGESRCLARKSMLFLQAKDLNNCQVTYRIDYESQGSAVDILREIRKGYKPVSVW